MSEIKTNRYVALDVLRGMTVAGMILVNNPGSWSTIFPPLRHAPWVGCAPTDLVFPFFLFVVGAAMAFSFAKYNEGLNKVSVRKLVKRGILIFLVGLALNAFPFYPVTQDPELSFAQNWANYWEHLRIFGVLQRIAMCYIVGGFVALWLQKPKKIIPAMVILALLHCIILLLIGNSAAPLVNGAQGAFSLAGQGSGAIDISLVGENHVYHGYGIPFDPEGILGALSGAGTVLLGYYIGQTIRHTENKIDAVAKLYTIAVICLALGCIWSIWLPISKPLWTGSYVLYAGGWAILCLAFFIYWIDVKGKEKPFTIFKAMGMNPLFAFVMAGVSVKLLGRVVKWKAADGSTVNCLGWFYQHCCVSIFGNNEYASLMYAICYVALFMAMAMWLYRKKIVIKL